ncbi:MAG: hypothetical protein ACRDHZ_22770, partial [Ktedonobacteraceae bacterium]
MSFEPNKHRGQNVNAMESEFFVDTDVQVVDADAQVVPEEPLASVDIDTEDHLSPESDALSWRKPSLVSKETWSMLARQFSPLLVPLPFAILVFLFTLPATLQGPPTHPSALVMSMLLLALVILQGTLLYLAGANDTLWLLSIASGYVLFVALGVGAVFSWVLALVILAALVV